MRRRTLLATVGAGLAAGCSESIPVLDPEETPTETDTAPPNPETPPESPPTETDRPTDTDAEPTATTDETDTPNAAERRGAEVVATARGKLDDAYTNYVAFAGADATALTDVTVATEVSFSQVTSKVTAARDALDDLPRRASGEQYEATDRLRGVATFLDQAVRCQDDLENAYSQFDYVVGRLYTDQSGLASGPLRQMREDHTAAADHLATVESETSADDVAAFDRLDGAAYEAKVTQLRRAVTAFGALPDALDRVKRGLDDFREASESYLGEHYLSARRTYPEARDELAPAADALSSLDAPTPMADAVGDLAGTCDALAKAAVDLETAADTGSRGEDDAQQAAFADAEAHLRASSVAVDRLEIVQRLLDD